MIRPAAPLLASALSILLASSSASAQTAVELFERGAARLTLDGLIRDWSGFGQLRAVDDRASVTAGLASWRGSDDASLGYALARDADGLWIAAEVRDDTLVRSAAHADADDHLSVALAVTTPEGRTVAYEVDLYPGEPGAFAGAVRFRVGGRGAVARAEIVEAPLPDRMGFTLEARVPWSAIPEVRARLETLRARVAYADVDAPRRASSDTVIATGPGDGAHPDAMPLAVGASAPPAPSALLDRFRSEHGVTVAARLDRTVDLAGDARPERVVVFPGYVVALGPGVAQGTAYAFIQLPARNSDDLLDVTVRDLTGDGKSEVVLRQRAGTEGGFTRELLTVYRVDEGGNLQQVFTHEVGRAQGASRLSDRVSYEPAGLRIEAGAPVGYTAATWPAATEAGVEAPLTPWSADRVRVFAWSPGARTFTLARSERNAAPAAAATNTPSGNVPAGPAPLAADLDGVLRLFRQREGVAEGTAPSHRASGDVAEDAAAEEVLVFGRTLVVVGPRFYGGRSYYSVALPLSEGDAVLDLRLADLTGDGKREAVLRVRRAVTAQVQGAAVTSQREMLLAYAVTGARRGRVFAAEVARRVGDRAVVNEVAALGDGAVTLRSGAAQGWTATTYPFHDAAPQGFFPLLLPWEPSQGQVTYRWAGSAFERAP
jgi:hypothetical protein